jgi:glucosamine-6-phosphate deaminase
VTAFPFQLVQRDEPAALMQACSYHLEQCLQQRLSQPKPRPLGLATGRTMEPLYGALVARLQRWPQPQLEQLRRHWLSFNLDDYVGLRAGDPCGYGAYMQKHLGQPLGLGPQQLCLPQADAADPQAAAQAYQQHLAATGGVGVQLLGLGSNGHVGFNEPPCSAQVGCRVVQLSAATRAQNAGLFGGDPQQVPEAAITLGLKEILEATEIHLVVTGSGKAAILKKLLQGGPSEQLPASWLRQHGRVWLWVDRAAMG